MRHLSCRDQKFRIQNPVVSVDYVLNYHRVYVVNKRSILYLVAQYTQIAAKIPNNNKVAKLPPLC